jgi:hypothetical protein
LPLLGTDHTEAPGWFMMHELLAHIVGHFASDARAHPPRSPPPGAIILIGRSG